jgi:Rne/Rng family ribonuclease
MSKEMYIASSPHETKVAVLEDDQLVEVHFERDTDVGLVGGIYKGRVSRVLPGMQSAFVDIGLERDAFLYVTDFFYEDQEEYDKVFEEAETRATKLTAQESQASAPAEGPGLPAITEAPPPPPVEIATPPVGETTVSPLATSTPGPAHETPPAAAPGPLAPPAATGDSRERRPFDQRRGRRRRHRGRPGFGESRFPERKFTPLPQTSEPAPTFEILPGESLAKYRHEAPATPGGTGPEPSDGTPSEDLAEEIGEPIEGERLATAGSEEVAAVTEPPVPAEAVAEATVMTRGYEPGQAPVAAEPYAAVQEPGVAFVPPVIDSDAAPAPEKTPAFPKEPASTNVVLSELPQGEPTPETESSLEPTLAAPEPLPVAKFARPYAPVVETEPTSAGEAFYEAIPESAPQAESSAAEADVVEGEARQYEFPEGSEEMAGGAEGEFPAEDEPSAEAGESPVAEEGASGEPTTGGTPTAPGDRTYTLRAPHQRPRFAPRRRRGRRGPGSGPHRNENRLEPSRPGNHQPVQISEVLREGQEILVQIAKEPLGTKGARITSHIALPGRYLVYMPTIDHIGVSRKISTEEERLRLRNLILENKGPLTGGFIVRTAGQGRSEEEFKADLKFLGTLWNEIRSKSDHLKAPALLHRDLDLVQRLLRDLLTPDFKSVRVDSEVDYERVLDFVNRCQPALIGKVKLYTRDTPLFEEFGIQQELEKALKPKVWLKSGGYIVINQTEALVAVDVNTGKYVGKTNRLEDIIVKTNIDAVNEIVRQVRLRDLGGIIVIDFIDMDERKNRAKVVQALEEALRSDRAPTKVISFHDFGLVAVTRKRVKQSLERTLCEPCDYCSGSGWIKSVSTVCNEILAEARKMAKGIDGDMLTLRVHPEVAKALKSREGGLLSELESLTKKDVIVKSDPSVHQERFEIY